MNKRILVASGITMLSCAAISAGLAFNLKHIYRVGDKDAFGGTIIETNVSRKGRVKYSPLVVPTDTYYVTQKDYSMSNVGDIESTWDFYTGKGTTVAIIDSGITHLHEDFIDAYGEDKISDKSAYFYTTFADEYDYYGTVSYKLATEDNWECMKHEYDTDYSEWDSHGSNVAGSAAASLNGVGTVGIAPDAEILFLKIDFYDSSINEAIKYAADLGVDVINMSLGAYDTEDCEGVEDQAWDDVKEGNAEAIEYAINKGVIVVAAAGNEAVSACSYPACNDGVIGVGALDQNSSTEAAWFSNFNKATDTASGNHNVDVMAPGYVYAPGLDESELGNSSSKYPKFGYSVTQGTSFASPIVAGAACLWKEKHPAGTPAQFETALYESAVDMGDFESFGNGRLDVYNLLEVDQENITLSTRKIEMHTQSSGVSFTATCKTGVIESAVPVDDSVCVVTGTTGSSSATFTVEPKNAGQTSILVSDSTNYYTYVAVVVNEFVDVTSVTVSETSLVVAQTKSVNIGASVSPSNASNQTLTYSSDNSAVASIDNKGNVTGVSVGTTTVYAQAYNGKSASVDITVVELTEEEYQIIFSDNGSDSSKEITASDVITYISEGSDYVTSASSISKVYKGTSGLKFGTSSVNGSITLTLSEEVTLVGITLNASRFNNDKDASATFTVNGKTTSTLSLDFADYTLSLDDVATSSLTISSYKRAYLKALTLTVKVESTPTIIPVTGIVISNPSLSLSVGSTSSLSAGVLPSDATNKGITWSSLDETIATVDQSGTVTGVSVGNTRIKVISDDGGFEAFCDVEVFQGSIWIDVTGIDISDDSVTINPGEDYQLTAAVYPTDATNKNVTWESDNTSIATVDENGKVVGVSAGSVNIRVTTVDGSYSDFCIVTVRGDEILVENITFDQSQYFVKLGETLQVTVTVHPSDATNQNVSYQSMDESVFTVDQNGLVTAVSAGVDNLKVSATDGSGIVSMIAVTVIEGEMTLNVNDLELFVDGTFQIVPTLPEGITGKTFVYSIDNTNIARISDTGLVTARRAGRTTIRVTTSDGMYSATANLVVKQQPEPEPEPTPTNWNLITVLIVAGATVVLVPAILFMAIGINKSILKKRGK